jgi:hypothetical protein
LGIAWTKHATYLPDIRSNGWSSTIYVRNDRSLARSATISFFNSSGGHISNLSSPAALLPNAVWIATGMPSGAVSAIVNGGEDISVVVEMTNGSAIYYNNYTGITSAGHNFGWGLPGKTVFVPFAKYNDGGKTTIIYIMNVGGNTANVSVSFYSLTTGTSCTTSSNVSATDQWPVTPSSVGCSSAGQYSARISTSTYPLAVTTVEQNLDGTNFYRQQNAAARDAIEGIADLGTRVFVPQYKENTTNLLSQNIKDSGTVNMTARYTLEAGTFVCRDGPPNPLPDANRTYIFAYSFSCLGAGSSPLTACVSSSTTDNCFAVTSGQKMAVVVNEGTNRGYIGDYVGSRIVILPHVRHSAGGWQPEIRVMNIDSANTATGKIRLYNINGGEVAQDDFFTNAQGFDELSGVVPANFEGSAVIEANRNIIAAITHTFNNDSLRSMITNGTGR